MVRLWAEKEMRNLKRLNAACHPVPHSHTAQVSRAGDVLRRLGGWGGGASTEGCSTVSVRHACLLSAVHSYRSALCTTVCHLVHADLSEYNLLYHRQQLVVIDVSQAVEHDHPQALAFLRKDIMNVGRYFATDGHVNVMDDDELLRFVLADGLTERQEEEWMDREMRRERVRRDEGGAGGVGGGAGVGGDGSSEFVDSFVPRRLDDIVEYEREYEAMVEGRGNSALHAAIRAMTVGGPSDERKEWKEEEKESAAANADADEEEDEEEDVEDDSSDDDVIFANSLSTAPAPSTVTATAVASRPTPPPVRFTAPTTRLSEAERRQRDKSKHSRRKNDEHDEGDTSMPLPHNSDLSSSDGEDGDEEEEEEEEEELDASDDSADASDSENEGEGDEAAERSGDKSRSKEELRAERKANKKVVKAVQAEKRKTKIPKKDKKRKVKVTSGKRR